ncbi:MAG: hypothetical protein WBP93_21420 [Pyrinomonadaceae bacterium]
MTLLKSARRRIKQLDYRLHRARLSLKGNGFSDFNEDEIISRYVGEILPRDAARFAVDIGAGDGIKRSNTYALFTKGWKGLGIESDGAKIYKLAKAYRFYPDVSLCRFHITPHNVVPLLRAYEVEQEFSLLSLDIDGYDYWVLEELLTHYRPRIIVSEINEKIPPPIRFVVKFNPDFTLRHHFYGYSIKMLEELCRKHRYAIVNLEYNNVFLVAEEICTVPRLTAEEAYHKGYLDRPDRLEKLPFNRDMEILHSLSPEEALKFLQKFYSKFEGEYEIGI